MLVKSVRLPLMARFARYVPSVVLWTAVPPVAHEQLEIAAASHAVHVDAALDGAAAERPVTELPEAERLCPHDGQPMQPIRFEVSKQLDYENELALVIGKKCKDIKPEDAYSCIAGYTILIDVSFRDQGFPQDVDFRLYKGDINWTKGKGMDNAAPMGPCIVTADEIPDPYKVPLKLVTRVNGKTRQDGTVENMIIKIPDLVSYMSRGTTLNPGDIIATGTCAGVAASWGPEGYLNVGDVLECEIQPIGVMKHTVVEDKGPV